MRLRFTVLGPVEAHQDGHAIDLGSPRQRNVLGALLIDVNNEVPTDELAIRIWGDDPPLRAAQTLQSYLSRLRSALPREIHRGPGGYAVRVDEDAVDLHRFRRLTAGARGTDDASAAALLSEALACWRGPLLAGLDTPWAVRLRGETQLERLAAELDLVDVRLRCGEHASVLAELTALGDEHPLDEWIARQLLLALYRSGRQAEALRRYEEVRVRLADELGADPGPALQKLHREMLTGAPSLDHVEPARAPAGPVPRQLPAPPAVFTGRQGELAALDAALDDGRPVAICAVGGTGGVGKTSLALHWAHRNLDRFPDGQLREPARVRRRVLAGRRAAGPRRRDPHLPGRARRGGRRDPAGPGRPGGVVPEPGGGQAHARPAGQRPRHRAGRPAAARQSRLRR